MTEWNIASYLVLSKSFLRSGETKSRGAALALAGTAGTSELPIPPKKWVLSVTSNISDARIRHACILKEALRNRWRCWKLKDRKNGLHAAFYESGAMEYHGNWNDGKKSGPGVAFHESGTIEYSGNWEDDKKSGYGRAFYESGLTRYDGDWKNDLQDGKGTEYWNVAHISILRPRQTVSSEQVTPLQQPDTIAKKMYEGQWERGKRHGQGVLYRRPAKNSMMDHSKMVNVTVVESSIGRKVAEVVS